MIQLIVGVFIGFAICYIFNKFLVDSTINEISFKEVENKNKKATADSSYWLLSEGEDKYLFTSEQLKTAKNRALKNPEDIQD